jgi:hypothetical protein
MQPALDNFRLSAAKQKTRQVQKWAKADILHTGAVLISSDKCTLNRYSQ